ncbi:hypothetical protein ElyMa_003337500 [Elysia marginata]|uniref:Uncharacterized protein n=1 Tax=Elysia marginata TaxID=1093978 RepID=A0AAV4JK57_9GAST|nr:hypothetical protein ElyMa_003337500 [Elysia marginata]
MLFKSILTSFLNILNQVKFSYLSKTFCLLHGGSENGSLTIETPYNIELRHPIHFGLVARRIYLYKFILVVTIIATSTNINIILLIIILTIIIIVWRRGLEVDAQLSDREV